MAVEFKRDEEEVESSDEETDGLDMPFNGTRLGIGAVTVLCMAESVPTRSQLFTPVSLMDALLEKGFPATGTIMKSKVPKLCLVMPSNKKGEERQSSWPEMLPSPIPKWCDNKPVLLASIMHGKDPEESVQDGPIETKHTSK
ncbi:hypothetical protein SRHO_G00238900 [Serrasalmus rhombeus]